MKQEELSRFLIAQTAIVVEAMQKIDLNAKGILFVLDENEKLAGVVTDGDIRRWLIRTGDLHGKVSNIMNRNPRVIRCKERKKAKQYMEEYSVTALPVVTAEQRVKDIIFKEEANIGEEPEGKLALQDIPVVIMAGGERDPPVPIHKNPPKALDPHWGYSHNGTDYQRIP